jgi:hypothetical protein
MSTGPTEELNPLDHRPQVRIFTLAEYVSEERSGRLYIGGGGLEWVGLPAYPDKLSSFDIAVRLAFPKAIIRESYSIEVRVLDAEGHPVGPDPLLQTTLEYDLDQLPADATEISGNLPVRISDYPVATQPTDVIFLHLIVDGMLISRLPVQLRPTDE